MKRFAVHESEMARVLMLMSHSHAQDQAVVVAGGRGGDRAPPERVFVCKTCNRVFPSFQALGGHRASHKKPRLDGDGDLSLAKPKLHGCSICGLEFAIGQALGGHMRRHRAMTGGMPVPMPPATTRIVVDKKPDGDVVGIMHHGHDDGGVKTGGLWLDLNHPPCDDDGCKAEVECGHINAATAGITFHQFLDTSTMAMDCLGYYIPPSSMILLPATYYWCTSLLFFFFPSLFWNLLLHLLLRGEEKSTFCSNNRMNVPIACMDGVHEGFGCI